MSNRELLTVKTNIERTGSLSGNVVFEKGAIAHSNIKILQA